MIKTSEWRADRNRQSLARLTRALPADFPAPVLAYALGRPFIPPTPRLAVDGYWRAHPLRADRLARALAARSGTPEGWTWQLDEEMSFRSSAGALSRPALHARSGSLLRLRATGLSAGLASGLMAARP